MPSLAVSPTCPQVVATGEAYETKAAAKKGGCEWVVRAATGARRSRRPQLRAPLKLGIERVQLLRDSTQGNTGRPHPCACVASASSDRVVVMLMVLPSSG